MERSNPNHIKTVFVLAAIILLALTLLSYFRINSLVRAATWVAHTKDVELELERTLATINEVEYNQRAYFLTKLKAFREPVLKAEANLDQHFQTIDSLTSDNPKQQINIRNLHSIILKRMDYLKTRIQDSTQNNNSWGETSALIGEVNKQVRLMQNEEKQLLNVRSALYSKQIFLTPLYAIFLSVGAILLLIAAYFKINQELNSVILLQSKFEQSKNELEQVHDVMIQKNQELINMNKELESFNYISSHDLQEPLRQIQMFASRIAASEKQNLSEPGKNYLDKMQNKAKRMQTLIADLLAYSRTNSSDKIFEIVNLNSIIQEVIEEHKETIELKQATVEVSLFGEGRVIPFQFHQMLHNLLGNALKFTNDRSPHIKISGSRLPGSKINHSSVLPEKKYLHISVSDNGIGFDPQYKERIFEVFQRLHDKEKITGTGIGLAIVKKIVDNHNGLIVANGELNQGATFDIYFPEVEPNRIPNS